MALKGNLGDFTVPQLLNLIHVTAKSGALTLHNDRTGVLTFRRGQLVDASLNNEEPDLAALLVELGALTERQGRVIRRHGGRLRPADLAALLVQAGYVTQDDIALGARRHLESITFQLIGWRQGTFRFEAGQANGHSFLASAIDLNELVLKAARRTEEEAILERALPSLDIRLRFAREPNKRVQQLRLTEREWSVVSRVSPRHTLRQIARATGLSAYELRRIVYGLLQVGLVRVAFDQSAADGAPAGAGQRRRIEATSLSRSLVQRLIDRIRNL